ncbi:hypothetical protein ALCH109712_13135 [Alkalicoccus chagannorensis]
MRCSGRNKERFLPSKSLQRFHTPFRPKGALRFCSITAQQTLLMIQAEPGVRSVFLVTLVSRFMSCREPPLQHSRPAVEDVYCLLRRPPAVFSYVSWEKRQCICFRNRHSNQQKRKPRQFFEAQAGEEMQYDDPGRHGRTAAGCRRGRRWSPPFISPRRKEAGTKP